jgi:hypothetical protein
MSEDAPAELEKILRRVTSPLISYCVRQAQRSNKWPLVDHSMLIAFADHNALPQPPEQGDNLIRVLGDELRSSDPSVVKTSDPVALVAVIGASSSEGVYYVSKELQKAGLLNLQAPYGEKGQLSVGLTFAGWQRYSELYRAHSEGPIAFMAMPFNDATLDKLYRNCFKPAVQQTGFELRRLDDKPPAGLIDLRMEVEIRRSRFLIAELTNENRGVYWEAGFAEGLGKPVIYTCEKSYFEGNRSHFDINHRHTIVWSGGELDKVRDSLRTTIRATLPSEAKMFDDA